jgi:hypothetical protein
MNNPVCAVCGHVNRVGSVACEMCDARLGAAEQPEADERHGEAREPFAPAGGPPRAASDASGAGGAWATTDEIPAPPFKGAGDVISPMLAIYRKHFTLVGLLVLVAIVPEALLQFGLINSTTGEGELGGAAEALAALSGVLLWLLSVASGALLSGSLVYAVVDLQRTGASSAGACLRRGVRVLPKVLVVTILQSLIAGAGFLLLIVPGVILSLMLAVCVPAAVVERLGPVEALKRSSELTKGHKGLIFMTYFLWGVLVFALAMVITFSFANGESTGLELLPMLLIQTAVLGMLNSTIYVLTAYIYLGLLYEHRSGFSTNTFTPGPGVAAR